MGNTDINLSKFFGATNFARAAANSVGLPAGIDAAAYCAISLGYGVMRRATGRGIALRL